MKFKIVKAEEAPKPRKADKAPKPQSKYRPTKYQGILQLKVGEALKIPLTDYRITQLTLHQPYGLQHVDIVDCWVGNLLQLKKVMSVFIFLEGHDPGYRGRSTALLNEI